MSVISVPLKRLTRSLTHRGGRNDSGRITNFHVGGGARKRGPVVNFQDSPSFAILVENLKIGRRTGPVSLFYHLFPIVPKVSVFSRYFSPLWNKFFLAQGFFGTGFFQFLIFPIFTKNPHGFFFVRKPFYRCRRTVSLPFPSPALRGPSDWVINSLATFRVFADDSDRVKPRYFLKLFPRCFPGGSGDPKGFFSYRIPSQFIQAGDMVFTGPQSSPSPGNRLPLLFIPNGVHVHSVPFNSGKNNTFLSLAGGSCSKLLTKYSGFSLLSLPSGEHRIVPSLSYATIGSPVSFLYTGYRFHKAGHSRWRAIRPRTRGVATNPVDHPHGGRTQRGRPARSFAFSSIKFQSTGSGRGLRSVIKSRKRLSALV